MYNQVKVQPRHYMSRIDCNFFKIFFVILNYLIKSGPAKEGGLEGFSPPQQ